MLMIEKDWVEQDDYRQKTAEYRGMDFYGPFLTLELKQHKKGGIEVKPLSCKIETPEISESDFSLLSKASKELYKEIGDFVLKTTLFDVTIDSEKAEELLLKKLTNLRLF